MTANEILGLFDIEGETATAAKAIAARYKDAATVLIVAMLADDPSQTRLNDLGCDPKVHSVLWKTLEARNEALRAAGFGDLVTHAAAMGAHVGSGADRQAVELGKTRSRLLDLMLGSMVAAIAWRVFDHDGRFNKDKPANDGPKSPPKWPDREVWKSDHRNMDNAAICRAHGWKVGDVIIGREEGMALGPKGSVYWHEAVVQVVWVGDSMVAMRELSLRSDREDWSRRPPRETWHWELRHRPWRLLDDADSLPVELRPKREEEEPGQ